MESEKPVALPSEAGLPDGQFSGRAAFEQIVRTALGCAAAQGWSEIIWSDASFLDWPLRERSVIDSLQSWSKTGRHLTLLATRFDEVIRHHARFVTWRRNWDHIIECRLCHDIDAADFPSMIWSPNWYLQRLDPQRQVGVCGNAPERLIELRQQLDEVLRRSSVGFAASTLGL